MSITKQFEHEIPFRRHDINGRTVWLPLVTVSLYSPNNERHELSLYFDSGASVTTLRSDLYPLLGLANWNVGTPMSTSAAGGRITTYRYQAMLEFLGTTKLCDIDLAPLEPNPLFVGLFGRAQMFEHFGFGYWERDHVLYITETP